jgi:transposase
MNGRVEVITGPERRRRWSDEEKLQLVAEACQPGNSVSQVARERGISASQLFGWRRKAMAKGLITDRRLEESAAKALAFAPVAIAKEQSPPDAGGKVRSARRQAATGISGSVEIELRGGDRVRVEGFADSGLVVRIISALRRA